MSSFVQEGYVATAYYIANQAWVVPNKDLIIINKYYNKLAYFHNVYIEIVNPVVTGKTWDKTPVGFFKVVNKISGTFNKSIA
jgi:hypothetical protein